MVRLLILVAVLVVAELLLRWTGCGYPTAFCLRANGTNWVQNDKFLWQFYSRKTSYRPSPFVTAVEKPANGLRVLVLGESAAAGTPDPAFGFGRILERMLANEFPQRRVEVISAAMPGVNSHVMLPLVKDCVQLKPDVVLIYAGNSEAMGLYAPGPDSGWLDGHRGLLQAFRKMHATRLAQCVDHVWDLSPGGGQGMIQDAQYFAGRRVEADDPRRAVVYSNFHSNLVEICEVAQRAGARVLLATVAVNLRDCPPLGSLHRKNLAAADLGRWLAEYAAGSKAEEDRDKSAAEALTHYRVAADIDDRFAELHFRMARCYSALEQADKSREEYYRAREWDALKMRADSRINTIIRQTAAALPASTGRLVDSERAFAEADPTGVPGDSLFYDHVNPNFDGEYLLAKTFLPALRELLGVPADVAGATNRPVLSRDECAARLAFTKINEWQEATSVLQAMALPPFTGQLDHRSYMAATERKITERFGNPIPGEVGAATKIYEAALKQYPEDWLLSYNLGQLLLVSRNYAKAIEQFQIAKSRATHWMPARVGLSMALSGARSYVEALQNLKEARALDPSSEAVRSAITAIEIISRGGGEPARQTSSSGE